MAVLASDRARISQGMTRFTHPVCSVLAESFNMAGSFSGFPVTLSAIAFMVRLVCFVGEYNTILELENLRVIICKSGYSYEKNCRN